MGIKGDNQEKNIFCTACSNKILFFTYRFLWSNTLLYALFQINNTLVWIFN